MESKDDQQVINRVLKGDTNAFGILVKRYQRPVFNLMFRMVGSADQAADLTQETFMKTYENLERFTPGRKFFPWLYAIGLNTARDFVRKDKSHIETNVGNSSGEFSGSQNPGEEQNHLCESLDFIRLERALSVLPLMYREALVLRYHEELPMKEVAQSLSITLSAAKMRVTRGLELLRQSIRGANYDR
jgi:RNA polymerase sigma-70 factor (ECF subfamily)